MFDIDEFIADCVAAKSEPNPMLAVKEIMDRAMSRGDEIADALPAMQAEFDLLYSSAEMSILKFVWGPAMSVPPHDHLMWAVNRIYVGAEDNVFRRRDPEGGIVESGRRRVGAAESAMLGRDVIHAVTNPDGRACTGLHSRLRRRLPAQEAQRVGSADPRRATCRRRDDPPHVRSRACDRRATGHLSADQWLFGPYRLR